MKIKYSDFLKTLTRGQKRYLSNYVCGWCNQTISRQSCGAIYEECSDAQRIARAKKCLKNYKPRKD